MPRVTASATSRTLEPFRRPLASALTPSESVLWLRGERMPFALVGDWLGGMTVLGSDPLSVAGREADPFEILARQPPVLGGDAAVGGGWVGWLGYGLGSLIEVLPPAPPAPIGTPPFVLAYYDHVVLHDGENWWFEGLWSPERAAALERRHRMWERRLAAAPAPARSGAPGPFTLVGNGAVGHLAAVEDCKRRIAEGELFQANLCVRLQAAYDGDPVELFAGALPHARPRFGALVDRVVSLSPERFLRRDGRTVRAEPIKGTRPRRGSEPEQSSARSELEASSKDAAEHVMIVDLMRNDLGRVCSFGTVSAERPRTEAHAGVWHLVSTVTGRLREGVDDGELLRATFPPGSVTGAPKIQAMKVIATLEATRREAYTGAIGIASPLAGLDLNVAIRTFESRGGSVWLGVGGGIVADSEPAEELDEALAKAAGPLSAIGGRLVERAEPPSSRVPRLEPALRFGARPDPGRGVFETILVQDRRPLRIGRHLDRLAGSVRQLYEREISVPAAAELARVRAAQSASRARLRILADSDGSLTLTLTPEPAPAIEPVELAPFALPGGLGAHKWRDRRLLAALAEHLSGAVPLLVDTDGLVLEAAGANVWIVEAGELITPPADGRILAGVTRAEILAGEVAAREEPIDLARLARADRVFLSSSISGRHPARLAQSARASTGPGAQWS
jgi:para-aminobenzoate synthetase / 4-amino-4-deoxychorismate lyase